MELRFFQGDQGSGCCGSVHKTSRRVPFRLVAQLFQLGPQLFQLSAQLFQLSAQLFQLSAQLLQLSAQLLQCGTQFLQFSVQLLLKCGAQFVQRFYGAQQFPFCGVLCGGSHPARWGNFQ